MKALVKYMYMGRVRVKCQEIFITVVTPGIGLGLKSPAPPVAPSEVQTHTMTAASLYMCSSDNLFLRA